MSTLRTFNLQHPESSNNNIQLAEGGGVSVTAGILTATNVSSTNVTTTEVTATNGTFSGNLSVGGVLSYEDVTNVDSIGIGTFRDGLRVTGDAVISHTGANPLDLYKYGTAAPTILMYGANGTEASPTQTLSGDVIGGLNMFGYGSSDWAGGPSVRINAIASENNGQTSNRGADIKFETVATGGTSLQERLRITSAGDVGIGDNAPNSSYGTNLSVHSTTTNGARIKISDGTSGKGNVDGLDIVHQSGVAYFIQRENNSMRFYTNNTERLRIHSSGVAQFTTTGTQYVSASVPAFVVNSNGDHALVLNNQNTTDPRGLFIYQDQDVNNTTSYFLRARAGSSDKAHLYTNGNLVLAGSLQGTGVNMQSSSTSSWFQTGASYGGTNYVWAAKDSSANVWHSGLQTDGDLLLGGNITGTSYIKLNGSTGNATFIGKVDIGNQYTGGEIFKLGKSSGTSYLAHYNGGTANGFLGHADQLVTGGSATDYAIRATSNLIFANGASESVRINPSGYAYFGGYPTTHTVASGSPVKVRSGAGAWGISVGMRYPNNDFAYIGFTDTNGTEQIAEIYTHRIGASNGHINFSTNNGSGSVTRARISNQGEFVNRGSTYCIGARSAAGSSSVNTSYFGAHSSNSLTTGTITYEVYTNGNVKNSNNSYSQLSDERLKENIIDAPSQWDDIKSLRIRKYNFRDNNGYETHTQIGLVAQETESVCPGLVQETPVREDATPVLDADGNSLEATKSVATSVLYMKAVKALQEAQTRIETLETQLTDALARIAALEG